VEYLNPPLANSLYNAEKAAKAKLDKFWWVDDTQWQKRFVVGARASKPEKEEPYKLWIGMSSAHASDLGEYDTWTYDKFVEQIHEAVVEKKTEVPLSRFKSAREEQGIVFQGYLLVDLEDRRAYGIRFDMKTSTSRRVETYLFPQDFC